MHTVFGNPIVRIGGLLIVLACCAWGEANLEDFPNCNGDVSSIGNNYCDISNNNEACGWDGGDCCECTCVFSPEKHDSCEFFSCFDPNSGCADDPGLLEYTNCTGVSLINNGRCDYTTNNEACEWDGKDCCECTCIDGYNYDCGSADFACLDPNSECTDPRLLEYSNCSGAVNWIDDGYCDPVNNNEACDWDGGDCCECTCVDGEFNYCPSSEFFCKDLDSGCTDALVFQYKNCGGDLSFFGSGYCTPENNNEACGWDGGDCCECTCEGEPCALNTEYGLFECLDPKTTIKSGSYGCLDWAPALTPCPSRNKQHWIVETSLQARDLVEALNCSGGVFEVVWIGSITVDQTLMVAGGTVLNVTGVGSNATIDGRGTAGLFVVSNASLVISNLVLLNGSSISGGAISALGSNVSLSRTTFIGNVATLHGGAVFIAGGSIFTCEEGTVFYNNSALHRGGALSASEGSHASWTSGTTFAYNHAVVGGAVDISSKSSVLWGGDGETKCFRNQATRDGGGLSVFSDSSVQWKGISIFEGNDADSWGGGLYVFNARAAWEVEAIFQGNTASSLGGGVFVHNGNVSWTKNTNFSDNFAEDFGGAVYAESRANLSWTGGSFFLSNVAGSSGGAVEIAGETTASWSAPIIFVNNTASEYGGGVALFDGSAASWVGKAKFLNNSVSSYNDDNGEISDGGALYVSSSSTILLSGSTLFSGNAAGGDGGALFIHGRASWEAETTFAYNTAGNQGGAVCTADGGSSISWSADTFFFNNTANSGGALVAAPDMVISGNASTIFFGNSAEVYGGAVVIISMDVGPVFYGVRFASNSAQVGGAVYAVTSGTLVTNDPITNKPVENPTTFNGCTFINNEAYATGGAVSSAAGQDMFVNTSFFGSVAGSGGALQLAGTASITDCLFEVNVAHSDGGPAVSNIGYLSDVINNTLRGNILSCESGRFLHFFEGRDDNLWEVICNGCHTACEGCNFGGTLLLVPQCISMSDAGIEHASSVGGVTTIEELDIDQGYWRATTDSIYVFQCYTPDACKGGLTGTPEFCEKGYQGPYCSVCSKNYTASLNFECNPCTTWRWGVVITTIVGGVSLVAGIAIVLHLTSGETRGSGWGVVNRVARLIPLQSLKIIIVAWQIVTQFAQVANVTFPDVYQRFLDAVDILNFELSWVLEAGCVFNFDFHDHLLIATIGPIVIVLLLGVTFLTAAARHQNSGATLLNIRHKHVSMVLLVTFLIYSNVSSMIFQMFACEVLDDGKNYLRADYRIECDSGKHQALQIFSAFMILLYPVGIPLLYAGLLFRDRSILRKAEERHVSSKVKPTSNLWKPYRPSRFYYEVIECARRISLTGAVVFIYPNTVAQVAVALVITFVFTVVSEALAPYDVGWDCWINRTGHVIVFMSMYIALLLKTDVSNERISSQGLLASVLVAAHACMVLAALIEALVLALSAATTSEDEPRRNAAARWQFTRQINGLQMHGGPVSDGIEISICDAEVESKSHGPTETGLV